MDHPTIDAGWKVMEVVSQRIASRLSDSAVQLYFTIIPTKEWVYSEKVNAENIDQPEAYQELVKMEEQRITDLAASLRNLGNSKYIDVADPLQKMAMGKIELYQNTDNGHPDVQGYKMIANLIADVVSKDLANKYQGASLIEFSNGLTVPMWFEGNSYQRIAPALAQKIESLCGKDQIKRFDASVLTNFIYTGQIDTVGNLSKEDC